MNDTMSKSGIMLRVSYHDNTSPLLVKFGQ